ncbi:MAG: hypothetical protein IPL70_17660 [Uliginosibacterium sp.]|nr:hypothetical protein [Uliginosibacterium sp.]
MNDHDIAIPCHFSALSEHLWSSPRRRARAAFTRERLLPLPRLIAFLLNARARVCSQNSPSSTTPGGHGRAANQQRSVSGAARAPPRRGGARFDNASAVSCPGGGAAGSRVLALDSTVLRVPAVPECAEFFGGMNTGCGSFRALARASALLDVARDCFVDAFVGGYSENDRSLAQRHLGLLGAQDLLVMDRGYPSRALFAQLVRQGTKFCARLSHSWSETKRVLRGSVADQVGEFVSAEAPLSLRILRHALPNGTVLVLITNVMRTTTGAVLTFIHFTPVIAFVFGRRG